MSYKSGYQEHVRGEGVVGVCPILSLDGNTPQNVDLNSVNHNNNNNNNNNIGPKFSYCSMCTGRTYSEQDSTSTSTTTTLTSSSEEQQAYMFDPAVSMEGEFEFKDFDTGEMFLVDIPKFLLPQAKVFTDEKYPYHPVQPEFQWEYK